MDAFGQVFGAAARPGGAANDRLDALSPTDIARRKLAEAATGLGSGIPDRALATLARHRDHLDRPLLAELTERLAESLVERAFAERRESQTMALHLMGVRTKTAGQLAAQRGEGRDVPVVHVLDGADRADEDPVAGVTAACGMVLGEDAVRVDRGEMRLALARYNRPMWRTFACPACANHPHRHPDADEEADYPALATEEEASARDSARVELSELLPTMLDAPTADVVAAAHRVCDDAAMAEAAKVAVSRGALALRDGLRDLFGELADVVSTHHGLDIADVSFSTDTWRELLSTAQGRLETSRAESSRFHHDTTYLQSVRDLQAAVLAAAADASGKALPADVVLTDPGRTLADEDETSGPLSENEKRAAMVAKLRRV